MPRLLKTIPTRRQDAQPRIGNSPFVDLNTYVMRQERMIVIEKVFTRLLIVICVLALLVLTATTGGAISNLAHTNAGVSLLLDPGDWRGP